MNKPRVLCFLIILSIIALIYYFFLLEYPRNREAIKNSLFDPKETRDISENLAQILWQQLQLYSSDIQYYDFDEVLEILKDIAHQKIQEKSSENCRINLMMYCNKRKREEARENLEKSRSFLSQLSAKDNMMEVIKNELYYEVLGVGFGPCVSEDSTPLLHYSEVDLSQSILKDTRKEQTPVRIPLQATLLGFKLGVIGMQQGERRKIYIHPRLAYGEISPTAPQQVLIFDVEILEVN